MYQYFMEYLPVHRTSIGILYRKRKNINKLTFCYSKNMIWQNNNMGVISCSNVVLKTTAVQWRPETMISQNIGLINMWPLNLMWPGKRITSQKGICPDNDQFWLEICLLSLGISWKNWPFLIFMHELFSHTFMCIGFLLPNELLHALFDK